MNSFVKRLREGKGWDIAQIYCKGFPPFMLAREAIKLTQEDECLIVPGSPVPVHLSPTETATIIESVVHLDEIVRIDFLKLNRIQSVSPASSLIVP